MRILYAASYPIPSQAANGVHVMKMAQAFAANGHDVLLMTPEYNREKKMEAVGDIFSWYGVVPSFKHKTTPGIFKGRIGLFLHAVCCLAEAIYFRADIIYARCLGTAYLVSLAGYPVVFEQHTIYEEPRSVAVMYRRLLKSKALKSLVVISRALKDRVLERTGIGADKIFVAHDGADPINKSAGGLILRKGPGVMNAGYVGHLYQGRGIDIIAGAAANAPSVNFHVIGGNEEDVSHWKRETQGLANIFFYGHVAPSAAQATMAQFDMLLAPYQEQVSVMGKIDTAKWMSPLKIFEYMAAGKPIICSDIAVLREVLRDGENSMLCKANDIPSWTKAISRLANDRVEAASIGRKASEDFAVHYTWQSRARNIIDFILKFI